MKNPLIKLVLILFLTSLSSYSYKNPNSVTNRTLKNKIITFSIKNTELKIRYQRNKNSPITATNLNEMIEIAFYAIQVLDEHSIGERVLKYLKLNNKEIRVPYYKGLVKTLEGYFFFINKNYLISKQYFKEALVYFSEINNKELMALCYDSLATTERILKNKILSLEYANKALNLFIEIENYENAIDLFFNQSVRYGKLEKWAESKENATKAIYYINLYDVKQQRLKYLYNKIALCNIKLNKTDSVIPYIHKALQHTNKKYIGSALRRIYYNYALYYELIDKKDSAIFYHKKTFDHFLAEIRYSNDKTSEFQRNQYLLNQEITKKNQEIIKKNNHVFLVTVFFLFISLLSIIILYPLCIIN